MIGRLAMSAILFAILAIFGSSSPTAAYFESFENMTSSDLQPLFGRSMQGSRSYVSGEHGRNGKALGVDYQFSEGGWVEVHLARRGEVEVRGDHVWVSMWVRGSGQGHFNRGSVRFIDGTGEVFEYPVSGLEIVLNEGEWRLFRRQIDLSAPSNSWGGNADGKIDEPLSFLGVVAGYNGRGPAQGAIYFDDIEVVAHSVPNLALSVNPNRDVAIFDPGEPISFQAEVFLSQWIIDGIRLLPADVRSFEGRMVWQVQDWQYRVVAEGQVPVQLAAGDRIYVPIDFAHDQRDLLQLHVRLVDDGGRVAAAYSTRAAVFTPAAAPLSLEPHFVGVAAHVQRYDAEERRRMIDLARMTGFGGVRFDLVWRRVEPRPGTYEWGVYDAIFAELKDAGLRPLPLLVYNPEWGNAAWNDPPGVADYVNYVTRAVNRYSSYAKHWEIWNEPDLGKFWSGNAEQYAELFAAAYRAVKDADPEAKVMNGGLSETKRRPDFIPRFLQLTREFPDIFAFHSHGPMVNMKTVSADFHGYLEGAGWTPNEVWLNEAGYSARAQQTETAQAAELIKKIAYSASLGHQAYIWYDLRNDGTDPNEVEHNFGLATADLAPKLALVAANTVMGILGGKQAHGEPEMTEHGLHVLRFADEAEQVLVIWTESRQRQELALHTDSDGVRVADWMGGESHLAPGADATVTLVASEYPQFVRIPSKHAEVTFVERN